MRKYLFIVCIFIAFAPIVAAQDGTKKNRGAMPTGYMSYGMGIGYSNNVIEKYSTDYYRNVNKKRTQGAFVDFTADVNFVLHGRAVVNKGIDGLMVGLYIPLGFEVGKARNTSIDPFMIGYKLGGGLSAIYKVNDRLNFSIKEYWAALYENPRKDAFGSSDAGLFTAFGVAYERIYFTYAHNFFPGKKNGEPKPLSIVNLKYRLNKGFGMELKTEYARGKADYKDNAGASHLSPYSGYTVSFGFTRIF